MKPNNVTNITLIERIKNRMDDASWAEFHDTYAPYITAILRRSSISKSAEEDLCQEILLNIWRGIETFEYRPEECRFRTWVTKICRNTLYQYYVKQNRRPAKTNMETLEATEDPEIDEIIEQEWQVYLVSKAFEKISNSFSDKAIRTYRAFQSGIKVNEIAEAFGISESSVYVYSKRIRDALNREVILLKQDLE